MESPNGIILVVDCAANGFKGKAAADVERITSSDIHPQSFPIRRFHDDNEHLMICAQDAASRAGILLDFADPFSIWQRLPAIPIRSFVIFFTIKEN